MDLATYDVRQARATASLKWILSKAFNNRVPDNLREPYYRDNENQERLKPQIIIELGNATLYCQALSNLYTDPNYQSLNHWSILQTLTRKGVPVADVLDMPLTETILIQTNPLKINAHLSVIESVMALYAKEMSSNDRILTAIRRISNSQNVAPPGLSYEQNLLLWVSQCCATIKTRIANDREAELPYNPSDIAIPRDFKDLCDGVALCLLVSYYCPKAMPWSSIRISSSTIVEDSVHNMLLIKNFCQNYLPYNIFHVKPEDVIYFGGPMKLNGIVMLADLFNLFEINVAKCVSYTGMENKEDILRRNIGTNEHGVIGRRGRTVQPVTPIPDLRTELPPTSSPTNRPPFQDFVVHKSKGITTLSSVHYQQAQQDAMTGKMRQLKDNAQVENKSDDRPDVAAGRPSHWDQNRRPSYAGRRSRRNSSSEDSQLTIENFGGSQDQLHNFGRYEREREPKVATTTTIETVLPARSSVADARGTLQLGYDTDSGSEKQDCETEKYRNRMPRSADSNSSCNGNAAKQPTQPVEKEYAEEKPNMSVELSETFPTENVSQDLFDNNLRSFENASKLCAIRMKLEEKQRRIEQEKRKIELALLRHQEKTIQDDIDNAQWETWSNDSKRTSEMEPVELDKYQQNIAAMNMNLQDIQQDIQRLATQQTHIQAQQVQAQQLMQAQQIANILNQQQLYGSQQHIPDSYPHRAMQQQPQNYGSNPHLNNFNSRPPSRDPYQQMSNVPMQYINEQGQYLVNQSMRGSQNLMNPQQMPADLMYNNHPYGTGQIGVQHKHMQQNYMHPSSYSDDYVQKSDLERTGSLQSSPAYYLQDMSTPHAQRRTWSKSPYDQPNPLVDVNAWQMQNTQTQANNHNQVIGYLQNGTPENQYSFPTHPSAQHPTYSGVQRQHSFTNLQCNQSPNLAKKSFYPPSKISADDMMAPQSICFIGDEDDVDEIERDIIESMQSACLQDNTLRSAVNDKFNTMDDTEKNKMFLNNVNIQSGNLTYRIPSPSRPQLNAQSFQDPQDSETPEKGFYISFDDDQPKRPKPPLRTKRSPKKENGNKTDGETVVRRESLSNTFSNGGDKQYEMPSQHNNEPTNYAEINATYNKYVDPPFKPVQQFDKNQGQYDRRHLEDVTNQSSTQSTQQSPTSNTDMPNAKKEINHNGEQMNKALIIGKTVTDLDPESVDEMEKRKEKIMLLSLQRRQQQEEVKARKEIEAAKKREREREKEDERQRKKEEQIARRAAILEQHRLKKALEEAEREGKTVDRSEINHSKQQSHPNATARLRSQKVIRRRPNTIHVDDGSLDIGDTSTLLNRSKKGSNVNLSGFGQTGSNTMKRDYYKGSQDSLATKVESPAEYHSSSSTPIGRRGSTKTSRELRAERDQSLSRISVAKGSTLYMRGRKSNSLMNLCETDSGLGRSTPPRRAPSPGISGRHTLSASGPGSLPPGLISKRRGFDDGSSDVSSSQNSIMEYSGPKLYKQPAAKSNRGIILNAVEYCVFPGVVNRDAKQKVLEKIARSEAKHFLILFRDAGCQFRALYSYMPETDQVSKLYGTGPSQVDEVMFDKFFKYNSGGKCFSQVHTKHLTVTIDAFTIHNSLWQGKKVHLPSKRDMALVI